jgi:hypothetical protein
MQPCLVCAEEVNHYPDEKCRPCRQKLRKLYNEQWKPSKKAADAKREQQSERWIRQAAESSCRS